MKMNRRNLLCLMFLLCNAFVNAQINVFWQNANGVSIFWDDVNVPWFYPDNSIRNKPNVDYNFSTKHNVYFGNNTGNPTIAVNGEFFGLSTFNIDVGATTSRTFLETFGGGIGVEGGIYNNSNSAHVFDVRIAIDQNNARLGADAGGLTFTREIFSNGRPFELRGNQPLLISGFISQGGSVTKTGTNTVTLTGANTYTGTTTINGGTVSLNRFGGSTLPSANDITINSGGTLQVSTNQTLDILTVNPGSTLQVDANTTLTITGAFTGGGTIINNGRIVLNGTALQSFPGVGATISAMNELEINNSSVTGVNMNSSIAITGSLILTTGTLNIAGNLLDLNGASLSRTSGFLNGSNTSDFTVRGNTGGTVTIPLNGVNISLRTVTISGNRIVAMNGVNNLALSGAFTIASGATYDNGGESQITQNTGGTISIDGTFITRDAQGFTGNNTSITTGFTPILNAGCTIEYGLAGVQAVTTRSDYSNLRFSGSDNKNISGAFNPVGTVFITGNAVVQQGSNSFGNGTTNLTMDGGKLVMTGARTSPDITGTYNLTAGVVEFAGPSNQTIRGTATYPYQNIEVTGVGVANSGGNINLKSGGTFIIKDGGVFTMNAFAIVQSVAGSQTVTVENNAKFICNDADGFSGTGNLTSVRTDDIDIVILQAGSTIEYGHTSTQTFSARTDYKNVIISGGGAKTLNGVSTISGILTLTSGLVNTTSTFLLTLSSTATCPGGGSSSSFINGPMRKTGTSAFVFPVGKLEGTGHYRTIAISAPSSTTSFDAEFFRANATILGTVVAPLVRVSQCEYWTLNRSGTADVFVTLSWSNQSPCTVAYVTNLATLVVAHNGSSLWTTRGNSTTTGDLTAGTITSAAEVSTFSPFALGSINQADNPLPFVLLNFEGKQVVDGIDLRFTVKGNNEQKEYVIEKSNNGIVFTAFKPIAAKANLNEASYNLADVQPVSGWNYYRLTAKSLLGETKQSQIIRIWFGQGTGKPAVYPNPVVGNQINLSTNGLVKGIYNLQVISVDGKQMIQNRWVFDGTQAIHSILLNQSISSGIYWLVLSNQNQEVVRIKIYK